MRELPILFSGAMVRALLNDSKTQTRRVIKLPHNNGLGQWEPMTVGGPDGGRTADGRTMPLQGAIWHTRTGDCLLCPNGQPGDRLWVRETWSTDFAAHYPYDRVWYAADNGRKHDIEVRDGVRGIYSPESGEHVPFRWRPSIHMPRALARITLEITGVRAERLQHISEQDAALEGVESLRNEGEYWKDYLRSTASCDELLCLSARESFRTLWDSLAKPAADWQSNPWVWVIELKRMTP